MKDLLKRVAKTITKGTFADLLIYIVLGVTVFVLWSLANVVELINSNSIQELQRSNAVLYRRVEILKNITCGQCHDENVPDEWGRHESN